MYWLLLTLIAISARATYSLATKTLTNRLHAAAGTQNSLMTGTAAIFGLLLSPWLGGISFHGLGHYWLQVVIMILGAAFGGITFFNGQKHLDAGTTQIAFSSILLWGVLLSMIFLGSRFSLLQAAGILLLFASIILVQYRKGKRRLDSGVAWVILSAALFAAFQVASAVLAKLISTATYLLLAYGGPTIVVGTLSVKNLKKDLPGIASNWTRSASAILFAATTSFGYYVFSYLSYKAAPDAGVVVVLLTSQVVLSVILGIIFLRERDNVPRKVSAGILAFLAGALIKA
jgi:uncharacterized membrane protein